MKLLILGSKGMLGSMCNLYFSSKSHQVEVFDRYFEYESFNEYMAEVNSYNPDIIINCIGKIKQKTDNFSELMLINAVLPHLIYLYKSKNSILVQPSTDCVFSGEGKDGMYVSNDVKDANDAYGISKIFGEAALLNKYDALILRGSIIGICSGKSNSLMDWFLGHNDHERVHGYKNHYWNGITTLQWCKLLELFIENLHKGQLGLFQFGTNSMHSKYELLEMINHAFKRKININPINAKDEINRCLESNLPYHIPPIEQQLKDLSLFYRSLDA